MNIRFRFIHQCLILHNQIKPNTPLCSPSKSAKKRFIEHQPIHSNSAVNSKELANLTRLIPPTLQGVQKAANVLQNGGLLSFPSETVYLVGCDARKEASVESCKCLSSTEQMFLFDNRRIPSLCTVYIVHMFSISVLKKLNRSATTDSLQSCRRPRYTIHVPSVDEARCHFSFPPARKYAYRKSLKIRNMPNSFTQSSSNSERNDSTDSSSSTNSLASSYCSNAPGSPISQSSSTSPDTTTEVSHFLCVQFFVSMHFHFSVMSPT